MNDNFIGEDYIIIKALDNGVTIMGLTREGTPSLTTRKSWTRVRS